MSTVLLVGLASAAAAGGGGFPPSSATVVANGVVPASSSMCGSMGLAQLDLVVSRDPVRAGGAPMRVTWSATPLVGCAGWGDVCDARANWERGFRLGACSTGSSGWIGPAQAVVRDPVEKSMFVAPVLLRGLTGTFEGEVVFQVTAG